jgi:triosephosphate isomerase
MSTTGRRGRKPFLGGNWKMYTNQARARELARAVVGGVGKEDSVQVVLAPPFPYLSLVADALAGSPVALAGQNCYHENEGAFTGEVSPAMLADVGCRTVILGHSERRHQLGESDAFINRKVHAALKTGLSVCLCIGETLQEREAGQTEAILAKQVTGSLADIDAGALPQVVLAYEPVWAIGTGKTATPEQAQAAHLFIRGLVRQRFGEESAQRLPIAYGGSVKPNNAADLMKQPDIDGGLIGGASLEASQFLAIFQAVRSIG